MPRLDGVQENNEVSDRFFTPNSHVSSDFENESINVNAIASEVAAQLVEQGAVERTICGREFDEKKWRILNGKKMRNKKVLQAYLSCHRGEPRFKRKHARNRRGDGSKQNVADAARTREVYNLLMEVQREQDISSHTFHTTENVQRLDSKLERWCNRRPIICLYCVLVSCTACCLVHPAYSYYASVS